MPRHGLSGAEWVRKLGHAAFGLLALAIPWLGVVPVGVAVAAAAIFNAALLPRLGGRRLWTPAERRRGFSTAIVLYPVTVLALLLLFESRPAVVAAAWMTTAFGDAAAGIVGRSLSGARLPWSHGKSWVGLLAFVLAGAPAAIVGLRVVEAHDLELGIAARCGLVAAVVGAFVESLDSPVDDNLLVPVATAFVVAVCLAQ